ncbi:conjugative transposon protein TraM [Ferruginibacter paludis]|uniref:conjugative transposon protein TraM n=1 Tax=Ferruginibacter paludis TaxID=1310417 RepID=UPI0025B43E8F|nr:conjugative transposon protein TraM [Ferruginibacter paludis]MDN3654131.1 conjugative transposon protein TraM [Ferruginibacter paludis]
MESKHSVKFLKQRKMMVLLPVVVFPFLTMAFLALGGGKPEGNAPDQIKASGLNLQLPNANLKSDKNLDKLSFYMEADADSLKRAELLRSDPFYKDSMQSRASLMDATQNLSNTHQQTSNLNTSLYQSGTDANEQKIYQKINEINKQINAPETTASSLNNTSARYQNNGQFTSDVDRMQEMMQMMDDKQETDPEMQQLNGTLDKILDIQHPQRVKDKLKEKSSQQREVVFPVSKMPTQDNISLLDTIKHRSKSTVGFYGTSETSNNSNDESAIEAVVHANQTLVNGAIIKLRLSTYIYINGTLIPKGNFVYGSASLNDERLEIEINSIRYGSSLFPVKLEVYDLDGLSGIHIPGAITRDVAKQSADNSLQLMELSSVDPSFKAQAAAAGISAAKGLLSRKVKQVKVLVKEGYRVLLKSKSNQ